MLILCIQSRIIFRCIIHRIIRHLLMLNLEVSWRPLMLQLHFSICKCLLSAHVNALEPPTHKQPYHLLVVAANCSKSIQLFMHLADSFIFRPTVFDNFLRRNDQFIWLSVPLLVLSPCQLFAMRTHAVAEFRLRVSLALFRRRLSLRDPLAVSLVEVAFSSLLLPLQFGLERSHGCGMLSLHAPSLGGGSLLLLLILGCGGAGGCGRGCSRCSILCLL